MRRTIAAPVLSAIFAFTLLACQKQGSETAKSDVTASSSPWELTLTAVPDPPTSGPPVTFRLKVTDTAGKPVAGARVTASLIMPLMDMGKNEVAFVDKGGGQYEGRGKFTMTGPWNVLVTASAQGKSGQQTFAFTVRE